MKRCPEGDLDKDPVRWRRKRLPWDVIEKSLVEPCLAAGATDAGQEVRCTPVGRVQRVQLPQSQ